jgi:hypothetical protein
MLGARVARRRNKLPAISQLPTVADTVNIMEQNATIFRATPARRSLFFGLAERIYEMANFDLFALFTKFMLAPVFSGGFMLSRSSVELN